MRDRTLEGYWWLAGQEDNKIPGILTYDGTEVSLRLLGAFTYDVEQSPGVSTVETTQEAPLIFRSRRRRGCHACRLSTAQFQRQVGHDRRLAPDVRRSPHAGRHLVG